MSRFSPRVLPTSDNAFADGIRAFLDAREQKKARKDREELMRRDADDRAWRRERDELELALQGIHRGTKPIDETSVMWGASIPFSGGTPRTSTSDVDAFADGLRGAVQRRYQSPPSTGDAAAFANTLRQYIDGGALRSRSLGPTPGFNPSASSPARPTGSFDPVSGTFTPGHPNLMQSPRYRQLTSSHYIDTEQTPAAITARNQAAQRNRQRQAYLNAGIPAQAVDAVLENPSLADNYLFPKQETSRTRFSAPIIGPNGEVAVFNTEDPTQVVRVPGVRSRLPSESREGSETIEAARRESYFNQVARNAILAANGDPRFDAAKKLGPEDDLLLTKIAAQIIVENPSTRNIFTQGMGSRHLLAAAQWLKDNQSKEARQNSGGASGAAITGDPELDAVLRGVGVGTASPAAPASQATQQPAPPSGGIDLSDDRDEQRQAWDEAAAALKSRGIPAAQIVQTLGNRP